MSNLKGSNVVNLIKYADKLLFGPLGPLASVLTLPEYCSSPGIGERIDTDLLTNGNTSV